jgi:hypothetical protein
VKTPAIAVWSCFPLESASRYCAFSTALKCPRARRFRAGRRPGGGRHRRRACRRAGRGIRPSPRR